MKGQSNDASGTVADYWYVVEAGSHGLQGADLPRLRKIFEVFDDYRDARARGDVNAAILLADEFRTRYKRVLGDVPDRQVDWYIENPTLIYYDDETTGQEGWVDLEDPDRRVIPIDDANAHLRGGG